MKDPTLCQEGSCNIVLDNPSELDSGFCRAHQVLYYKMELVKAALFYERCRKLVGLGKEKGLASVIGTVGLQSATGVLERAAMEFASMTKRAQLDSLLSEAEAIIDSMSESEISELAEEHGVALDDDEDDGEEEDDSLLGFMLRKFIESTDDEEVEDGE